MRRTKTPAIALARMRAALGMEAPDGKRSSRRQLAFLADQARWARRNDIREAVRWTGHTPPRGLKGWEADALDWLRVD